MKKSFSARRVPRKIGQDDDEPSSSANAGGASGSETVIQRPAIKPRKSSALRPSFRASAAEDDEDESSEASIVAPKKANLSRVAVQRNALKRSSLLGAQPVSRQNEDDDDRPSYSAASLQELKDSTPSTPRDFASPDSRVDVDDVPSNTRELDLSSKFDSSLATSAIPSAMEIAEKKARRARLAKEQAADKFISLDPDDPSLDNDEDLDENVTRDASGRLILKPKDKDKYGQASSRLVRDDEDVLENFDEFTEPTSQLAFSRNSEAEALRRRKQEIANQIAEAEAGDRSDDASDKDDSDNASDDSEKARNAAFEAAQTRHGMSASVRQHHRSRDGDDPPRPRTPPKISPLPTLDAAVARLRTRLAEMQTLRSQQLRDMEALQREKVRLGDEEIRIQKALRETGEKFVELRREKGMDGSRSTAQNDDQVAEALVRFGGDATPGGGRTPGADGPTGLGFGGTTGLAFAGSVGSGVSRGASADAESDVDGAGRGLGYGGGGRGSGSHGSSALGLPAEGTSAIMGAQNESDGYMDTE